jgi:lipoprotein-anchoring transpeptidase ErfK/SrfK
VRPRPGRIAAAVTALAVTGVTMLAGVGVPLGQEGAYAAGPSARHAQRPVARQAGTAETTPVTTPARPGGQVTTPAPAGVPAPTRGPAAAPASPPATSGPESASAQLPGDTGVGRRIVFDISAQRVWLVDAPDRVVRTYLVSGSLTGNLKPGDYRVYSRQRHAIGIDDSGTMQYFVVFTHGQHAAIGFHSIPVKDGRPLQTVAQLGTPQSHGCIRQTLADARRLWAFAPLGTDVRVIA